MNPMRPYASCSNLAEHTGSLSTSDSALFNRNWTLTDALKSSKRSCPKLPLDAFNHISREVICLTTSKHFYVDILGFLEMPRPDFKSEGCWLYGYGLNLHLVRTLVPAERLKAKIARLEHFSAHIPTVDHFAFVSSDLTTVRAVLDSENVYYSYQTLPSSGLYQIFFFDPDGNVVEISNCAPPVGEIACLDKTAPFDEPTTSTLLRCRTTTDTESVSSDEESELFF